MATNGTLRNSIYWSGHLVRHAPRLAILATKVALNSRVQPQQRSTRILVGTHHKVLTVFLGRVFRVFAHITGRPVSQGKGDVVNYAALVLLDTHSQFDFDRIGEDYVGIHVRRDPRDMLVSSANYHLRSREAWLHVPRPELGGMTYQEKAKSIAAIDERMLFELENETGVDIRQMIEWQYGRPRISELRYEDLVGPAASGNFRAAIADWPMSADERELLGQLFDYFSIGNPGANRNKHIRNPSPGQGRDLITPVIEQRLEEMFPGAIARLGYGA